MKIAFLAKKGGAGKTTSSLLVAEALRQAGNHVALQDFDKQGSSTKSIRYSGSEVEIAVPKSQYTYIVFDTPPNLEHAATQVAVKQADVVIVVTGQTVVDFWEVGEAVTFAEKTNPRAVVRVLVNRVKAGTILARSVEESVSTLQIKALKTQIPDRQVFAHFVGGGGWNVLDRAAQALAGKLALEIVSLPQSASLGQGKRNLGGDMAKAKYNPMSAFRDDPLAALKQATGELSLVAATGEEGGASELGSQGAGRSSAPVKPLASTLKPSRNTVYLYPDDLTKLRQLSGYASTEHGVRANDSMIVRAALSLLEADVRFLHALKEAELSDRRRNKG